MQECGVDSRFYTSATLSRECSASKVTFLATHGEDAHERYTRILFLVTSHFPEAKVAGVRYLVVGHVDILQVRHCWVALIPVVAL